MSVIMVTIGFKSFNLTLLYINLVVIIALGLDFSLHIISGYFERRNQGLGVEVSIHETLQRFGSGILIGGIATGLAFLTLLFSEIKGIQEIGMTVGIGIIITMLATIIILPTILVIRERMLKKINTSLQKKDVSYLLLGQTAQLISKNRWVMMIILISLKKISHFLLVHRST